jgi:hypothetical protein
MKARLVSDVLLVLVRVLLVRLALEKKNRKNKENVKLIYELCALGVGG